MYKYSCVGKQKEFKSSLLPKFAVNWFYCVSFLVGIFKISIIWKDIYYLQKCKVFIDWSIDWFIDWLIYWLIDWSIYWLIDLLIYWLIDLLIYWFFDWFIDLFTVAIQVLNFKKKLAALSCCYWGTNGLLYTSGTMFQIC